MSVIRTDVRDTIESAERIRFDPESGITATNVQDAIVQVGTSPQSVSPVDVDASMSPFVPAAADTLLWVDTSAGPVTISLPTGASRNGRQLQIKDISGDAFTNNITLDPAPTETIDGLDPMLIDINYGGYTLYPKPSGGWTTQP